MDLELRGKTALVTASTGGIGFAIAAALAREGAAVGVNGRTAKGVSTAVERIRSETPGAVLMEVVADNSTAAGAAATTERLPAVDILVNNLGIYRESVFVEEDDERCRALWETNVMSAVRLCRHYLPEMMDRPSGRVVMIASESALMPDPRAIHYSATKAALLSVARGLAETTQGTRVTVNALVAGPTRTDSVRDFIAASAHGSTLEEAEARFMGPGGPRGTSLIGRLIEPREIADTVAFLASPRSAAINGSALRIDGGLVRSIW